MSSPAWTDENGRVHYLVHHETVINSCAAKLLEWEQAKARESILDRRCGECWLRQPQCYCEVLSARRSEYQASPDKYAIQHTEVLFYYAFKEVGRSPNTAHIYEYLFPDSTSRVVMGQQEAETALVNEIANEYFSHNVRTSIMYPCKEAKLVREWVAESEEYNTGGPHSMHVTAVEKALAEHEHEDNSNNSSSSSSSSSKRYRLVALDGTYSEARRMFNYLSVCLRAKGVPVPTVKLDVGEKGFIESAYLGLMNQPGKEKICTFQAVVMALQDLGEHEELCSGLHQDLDRWIHMLMENKIKQGKEKIRIPGDLYTHNRGEGEGKSSDNNGDDGGEGEGLGLGGNGSKTNDYSYRDVTRESFKAKESVKSIHERFKAERGGGKERRRQRKLERRLKARNNKSGDKGDDDDDGDDDDGSGSGDSDEGSSVEGRRSVEASSSDDGGENCILTFFAGLLSWK